MRLRDLTHCVGLLANAVRTEWSRPEVLRALQRHRLAEQVAFASRHVPFYQKALTDSGVDYPALARGDLTGLPITRREQIQGDPEAFLSEVGDRSRWRQSKTSGSTGRPLITWFDPACWRQVKGILKARRLLAWGWRPGRRFVVVDALQPQDVASHARAQALPGERWISGRTYLSVFEPPAQHVARYRALRPHGIYAFPSYLQELAVHWDETMRRTIPLRMIMTSAEWIHPSTRQGLERAFGARVLDTYGLNEVKEIAWQCPSGNGYHVNMESVLVEIVDEHGHPVPDGERGEVVITSLTNRAMPLLRYATGDLAVRLVGRCACGRGLERLDHIEGRLADYIRRPGHDPLSPYELTTAIETHAGIAQYKIRHRADGVLETSLVLHPEASQGIASAVRESLRQRVGGLPVTVQIVASIPRAPSGKARCVEIESSLSEAVR